MRDRGSPRAEDIEITGVFHLIDLVCAGWSRTDLAEHNFAIGLAVPLHMRESRTEFERFDHVEPHANAIGKLRVIEIA